MSGKQIPKFLEFVYRTLLFHYSKYAHFLTVLQESPKILGKKKIPAFIKKISAPSPPSLMTNSMQLKLWLT